MDKHQRERMMVSREQAMRFRRAACFDDLVKAGRVASRTLPDGSVIPMMENHRSNAVRSFDPEARTVSVIASDGQMNRYGDFDDPDGWIYDHFREYPAPVLIDHWYSIDALVGKVTAFRRDGDLSIEDHLIDPAESSPRTAMLLAKLAAGSANTVSRSFGALAIDKVLDEEGAWTGQFIFREMDLYETSWVVVPAVKQAHRLSVSTERPDGPVEDDATRAAALTEFVDGVDRKFLLASMIARIGG